MSTGFLLFYCKTLDKRLSPISFLTSHPAIKLSERAALMVAAVSLMEEREVVTKQIRAKITGR